MSEIRITGGARVWTGPVGGDGPYTELGYTTDDITCEVEDEFSTVDFEALKRGLAGGQVITTTLTMTRRQMRNLWRIVAPRTRNRRRNPLHAVRDRLRREQKLRRHAR